MTKSQSKAKKSQKVVKKNASNAAKKAKGSVVDDQAVSVLPPNTIMVIKDNIRECINDFERISANNLTAIQRRRKIGAGTRNYGFIDKVSDLAVSNPEFAKFISVPDLKNCIRNVEICRDIVVLLQTLTRMVSNAMLVYSDEAYTLALIYYNSAKELARRGNPNAMEVFRELQTFFRKPRRGSSEPSAKMLERDIHSLLKGTKDGKIVIENEKPKVVGGKRLVVDRTRSNKNAYKEVEQGEEVG